MRMKILVCTFLLGSYIVSHNISAQSVMTFEYGEKNEFEGQLTAYLLALGKQKKNGKRSLKVLDSDNFDIDPSQYEELTIVLRLTNFTLEKPEHYKTTWLELPLQEYIKEDLPGLVLVSKTRVLLLGADTIPRARQTGDIRFTVDPDLDRRVEGLLEFSFDFISSDFPWKKIDFKPVLKYAVLSVQPLNQHSVATNPSRDDPEKKKVASEEAGEKEKNSITAEIHPEPEKVVPLEEKRLMEAINDADDDKTANRLCEEYRKEFPGGFFEEEVLFQQIELASTAEDRSDHLETYVKNYPDGRYIRQVNEMIFLEYTSGEKEGEEIPGGDESLVGEDIQASINLKDGILTVDRIEGGEPPYRLEFFDVANENAKSYAIDIGRNRSFKTNLNALPLDKKTYIIGVVDAKYSVPYYSEPFKLSPSKGGFRVEVPFLTMVLGISILTIALFLLVISRFFSKKRRKRYRYRSYR